MNFNSSVYPSVVTPLSNHLGASEQAARVGQYVLLALYAIGCERWAPWSKSLVFGQFCSTWILICRNPRRQVTINAFPYRSSLFLVNIWQILAALASNFGSIIAARALLRIVLTRPAAYFLVSD